MTPEAAGRVSPPRVLLVDDDVDSRELYALGLKNKGFAVDQAAQVDVAMDSLRQRAYDIVVVHYNMPGRTGSTMLREASAAGLLGNAASLIFSGDPEAEVATGSELLRKPFDVDSLAQQLHKMLKSRRVMALLPPMLREAGKPGGTTEHVELVLYVSSTSLTAAAAARQNIERILEGYETKSVRLSICDVALEPGRAEEDRITFTPTLVKRRPEPRAWVLGNLTSRAVLEDLLLLWGVDPIGRFG